MKLKINNKDLEFTFGLEFIGELLETTNKDLSELLILIDKNPFKYIPLAMFVSTKTAYEIKGKEIDFTKHEFYKWFEADGGLTDKNENAIKFLQGFQNSIFKDVPKEDEVEGDASKKK